MTTIADVRARALAALAPPPRLALSAWIERELRLPGDTALPGRVRLWPYQVGIADAISDPLIERVTLVKPARLGFTTLLTAAIGSRREGRCRGVAGVRQHGAGAGLGGGRRRDRRGRAGIARRAVRPRRHPARGARDQRRHRHPRRSSGSLDHRLDPRERRPRARPYRHLGLARRRHDVGRA
jgi:Phage terminase large subunit (GpA)